MAEQQPGTTPQPAPAPAPVQPPVTTQPSAPMPSSPFAFQTGVPYKVHKSYIWAGPLLALGLVIVAFLLNGSSGIVQLVIAMQRNGLHLNGLWAILAAFGFVLLLWGLLMVVYVLAYRHMFYQFDPLEFSFHSGVFVKKCVHVPYEKIQSVNQRATLVQRIIGVCTVTIDSAGGSSNKGVRVPYVTLQIAEAMRSDLFARKAASVEGVMPAAAGVPGPEAAANVLDEALGAVGQWRGLFGGAGPAEEPVSFSYGLRNGELLLAALSHPGPLAAALVTALCAIVTIAFGLFAQDAFSVILASLAAPIAIGAVLLIWVFGSVGLLLGYGGFKVRRRGSRIEVERGLVSRNFSGIDVSRVQSIEVRQSLLRRLLGYCELSLGRIDTASQQSSESNNSSMTKGLVIHPFVKLSEADALLSGLIPEFDDRPRLAQIRPLPKPALGRAIRRRCLWFNWVLWTIVAVAACWGLVFALFSFEEGGFSDVTGAYGSFLQGAAIVLVIIFVLATAAFAVSAVLWARHSGCVWTRRFLLLHNDGLAPSTSIIPRQKLQCGYTRSNPFQRRQALTSIVAVTAAGTGSTEQRLLDVTAAEGEEFLQWLR